MKNRVATKKKKRRMTLEWRSTISLGFLTLPAIVWFIVFCYIPMFGIIIAFKDFDYAKGIFGSDWCGFDNFVYLFKSNDAFRILRNTILYNFSFIVIGTIAAIAMALMLDSIKSKAFIKFTQTTIFLPYFISWVVVAFVTQQMFALNNGAMNSLIEFFGGEKVLWYTNTKAWPIILIIANLWKQIGFNTIVYYGSILGIDSSLYEAARIDGASGRQCITKITLPLLKPTIVILFIMSILSSPLNLIIEMAPTPTVVEMAAIVSLINYSSVSLRRYFITLQKKRKDLLFYYSNYFIGNTLHSSLSVYKCNPS